MSKKIEQENQLTEQQQLDYFTHVIWKLKKQTAKNIIDIGQYLRWVKEILPYGEFTKYLEEKVDFTRQQANKFMKIYEVYNNESESKSTLQLDWGVEKLYTVIAIPENDREKFIEENNIDEISTRELKKKVKEFKNVVKECPKSDAKIIDVEVEPVELAPEELDKENFTYDTDETILAKDINDSIVITKNQLNRIKFKTASKAQESLKISLLENKTIVDTEKILKKVDNLIKEIKIRTGEFYTDNSTINDVKCDDRGGVLAQLYALNKITEQELIETVKTYNIDLEINFKELLNEKAKENYLKNISNSYNHYFENENYIDVVDSRNLSFENTTDFSGWCEDKSTEDFKKNYKTDKDGISILVGYDDNGDSFLCIYKDKKLMGHFRLVENWNPLEEDKELLNNIKALERFVHIELEELFEKWLKQYTEYFKREQKRQAVEAKERKKRQKYDEKKKEFEMKYGGKTSYKFEDIYNENCDIQSWEKYKDNQKQYEDYEKRWKEQWKNFDYDNIGGFTPKSIVNVEDKPIYKKFYRTLALNFHPDKIGGDGKEMQIINELKQNWGI